MVKNKRLTIVLIVGSLIVLSLMASVTPENQGMDEFTGLCVYSSNSFSVLSNGRETVGVNLKLKLGGVYNVKGRIYNSSTGLRMKVLTVNPALPNFELESMEGFYWHWGDRHYLLTPVRVKLGLPLPVRKGERVLIEGIWHGGKFYPVRYSPKGLPQKPGDGLPWIVKGTIIHNGTRILLWNGSEVIRLYLPYGTKLRLGSRVRVVGIARLYSTLSLLVQSVEDVAVLGEPTPKPLKSASVGDLAVGNCTVLTAGRSLGLDCSEKPLYGFSARIGDQIRIKAVVRPSSLYCLNCTLVLPRESLPNSICSFEEGSIARIEGRIEWIKVYKNGFGIANVTQNDCWILLKLRKSLGVYPEVNQTITAYGFFTTYRGVRAFEVPSRDDLCLGRC